MATRTLDFVLPPGVILNQYAMTALNLGLPTYQWLLMYGEGQAPVIRAFLTDLLKKLDAQMLADAYPTAYPPTEPSPAPNDGAPVVTVPKGSSLGLTLAQGDEPPVPVIKVVPCDD